MRIYNASKVRMGIMMGLLKCGFNNNFEFDLSMNIKEIGFEDSRSPAITIGGPTAGFKCW